MISDTATVLSMFWERLLNVTLRDQSGQIWLISANCETAMAYEREHILSLCIRKDILRYSTLLYRLLILLIQRGETG